MSSFLAHSMIGIALVNQKEKSSIFELLVVSLFFLILASSPDIDYLITYFRAESMPIRYTHSLGYIILVGLGSLVFRNIFLKKFLKEIPLWLFFLVPFSHLLLDFLVGVHANPYFYPLLLEEIVSPVGILPSSGRIDLHNFYFWRNLGIELAIFVPTVFLLQKRLRAFVLEQKVFMLVLIVLFIIGVMIGMGLDR